MKTIIAIAVIILATWGIIGYSIFHAIDMGTAITATDESRYNKPS